MPIIKGVTIINHSWVSRGSKHPSFIFHPYCKEFKKADLKRLSFLTPLQIRNRQSFQKKAFLIQPLIKTSSKQIFKGFPLSGPRVPIIQGVTIINHSWVSRGSKHPSFIFHAYCKEFKKADPKRLSFLTPLQIRNRQSFKKKAFLIQPLIKTSSKQI